MFARITSFRLKSDKFNESVHLFHEADRRLKQGEVPGYLGAWLFVDNENYHVITHTLWEDEAASLGYEKSPMRQEMVKAMPDIMAGEQSFGVYEVVAHSLPGAGGPE